VPAAAAGQEPPKTTAPPEALLARDSIVYLRFDGLARHRQAYDQTALAQVLNGELGDFLLEIGKLIQDALGPQQVKDKLLSGLPPDQLVKVHSASKQLPLVLKHIQQHGFVVGVEVVPNLPPKVQATVVFPEAGEVHTRNAFFATLQLLATIERGEVEQVKVSGRDINRIKANGPDDVQVAWWQEGSHIVLTIGTEKVEHTLGLVDGKTPRANLTASPLFQSVSRFNRYETIARGYVDLERLLTMARAFGPPADQIIDELGFAGLKDLTFHLGFAGKYQQSTITLRHTGERKGWLKLLTAPADLTLAKRPPLPPDATSVAVLHLEPAAVYDLVRKTAEVVAGAVEPNNREEVKKGFDELDKTLGLDVRKDLLATLGSTVVLYNSPGEGLVFFGWGLAVEVKDPKRLQSALDTLSQSLSGLLAGDGSVQKVKYQGVDAYVMRMGERDFFPFLPSWTVHNGWLVIGISPQSVKGVILRSQKPYSVWKPSPVVEELVKEMLKNPKAKLLAVSEADPRTSLKAASSYGQLFVSILSLTREVDLDPASVPHFQALTEPLFPNAVVVVDEGDALRIESRGSLALPVDALGLDSTLILFLISAGL
jgi:hypothetical protein